MAVMIVLGGVASLLSILAFVAGLSRWVVRGIGKALDEHMDHRVDPRFDKIEGRLDEQDHALDLQSQAITRLEGRWSTAVRMRRTGS